MRVIDCKAIRDDILNNIPEALLKGKNIFAISKHWSGGNVSYLRSIESLSKKMGVGFHHHGFAYDPTAEDIAMQIYKRTVIDGKPPAVLLLGYTPEQRTIIAHRLDGFVDPVKLLDPPYNPNVIEAVERVLFNAIPHKMTEPLHTVIIGRSELAMKAGTRLLHKNHTVTFVHTGTDDLTAYTRKADVIVSFAGCPDLIKSDMVKDGAVIVSVGCGSKEGKLCGDIDMESMKDRDVLVTPTPGGVGIITTALLFKDLAG